MHEIFQQFKYNCSYYTKNIRALDDWFCNIKHLNCWWEIFLCFNFVTLFAFQPMGVILLRTIPTEDDEWRIKKLEKEINLWRENFIVKVEKEEEEKKVKCCKSSHIFCSIGLLLVCIIYIVKVFRWKELLFFCFFCFFSTSAKSFPI